MAGPTRATGYTDYSSNSTSRFIPEVWSGRLVTKFYGTTVFGEIASTEYQGDINGMGDNVIIRTRPTITINDYQIGGTLSSDQPSSPATNLSINNGKYFNFPVSDVDEYQSDLSLMDEFTDDGTEQMQQVIDTDILGNIYGSVAAANAGTTAGAKSGGYNLGATGTPLVLDKTNVTDFFVDVSTVLGEQNIPRTGRWIVIPEWMGGMIMKSDLSNAAFSGDGQSILRNGRLGMIGALTVYVSNNLSMVADTSTGTPMCTNIIAGHSAGLTFASQMTNLETLRNPNDFGNLVRGLNVYGYKVIEPKYLAHGYVKNP